MHININPELLIKLVAIKLIMWAEEPPWNTHQPWGNPLLPWEGLGVKYLLTNGVAWGPSSRTSTAQ